MNKQIPIFITLLIATWLVGCKVGPNFSSPQLDIPKRFNGDTLASTTAETLLSLHWWTKFNDPILDSLIHRAAERNRDIKATHLKVEQAYLQFRNTRSALAPSFTFQTGTDYSFAMPTKVTQTYSRNVMMSWEVDLFGGLSRNSESVKATAVSTMFQYNASMLSLTAQVAQAYFALLEYKLSLVISEKSYRTRLRAYELMTKKYEYGAISMVALNQAKTLMLSAQISVENYRNAITQTSNSLCMLLGDNPHDFDIDSYRILSLHTPPLPTGITPAWVIDNRPDVMSAYYDVWSNSAKIGVAVARRLPLINITANGGVLWEVLHRGASVSPFVWGAGLSIAETLLKFGTNKRNEQIARLANKASIYTFEQTVITAFAEVENALGQISTLTKRTKDYLELVSTTGSINKMTGELYRKGAIDYLQVLDAERAYLSTQLDYCNLLQQQMSSYVSLYKSLGGGI